MRAGLTLLFALAFAGCVPNPRPVITTSAALPAFVDVAPAMGVDFATNPAERRPRDILAANGAGVGFLDYDGDGRQDLLLAGKPRCALFRNEGTRFVDVSAAAGINRRGHWIGVGAADWDNDGDPDLCLTGFKAGALYRNDGGRFEEVTGRSGIRFPNWGQSAAFGDVDADGLLDLYVSAYARFGPDDPRYCQRGTVQALCGPELYQPEKGRLFRNLGGGRFQDVTRAAGIESAQGRSWGAMFQDYDDDGDADLYVANDMLACDLFENDGGGRFRNVGLTSGTAFDGSGRRIGGMTVDWADYDADLHPDLLVSAFSEQHTVLFRQKSRGAFSDASDTVGVSGPTTALVGFGGGFLDYDRDGWRDLLLANGHLLDNAETLFSGQTYRQPLLLLRNREARFEDVSPTGLAGVPAVVGRGVAFGDFDNDGRRDALVSDLEGSPLLLRNQAQGGRWLGLRLVGRRSNRDALGTRVFVTAAGRVQRFECQSSGSLLSNHDRRIIVGMGSAARADEIRILWPSGRRTVLKGQPVDRYLEVREPQ